MKMTIRKVLRIIAGIVCLILGFVGLFLPFLQGILLLCAGALLLSPEIPAFQRLIDWASERYPRAAEKAQGLLQRLRQHE